MDHQSLLCAHYSLQKARTLPRSQGDIKNDEADFSFLFFCVQRNVFPAEVDLLGPFRTQIRTLSRFVCLLSCHSAPTSQLRKPDVLSCPVEIRFLVICVKGLEQDHYAAATATRLAPENQHEISPNHYDPALPGPAHVSLCATCDSLVLNDFYSKTDAKEHR